MASLFEELFDRLFFRCQAKHPKLNDEILDCLIMAVMFVGSLYVCVPSHVRALPRDNVLHIQWRALAVLIATLSCILFFVYTQCIDSEKMTLMSQVSALVRLGFANNSHATTTFITRAMAHVFTIYLGSNIAAILQVHAVVQERRKRGFRDGYWQAFYALNISPILSPFVGGPDERWKSFRNLILAPISEEVVFRSCMATTLLHSRELTRTQISWITPLFFGVAHLHHATTRLGGDASVLQVAVSTLFQFTYTTLFGAYATHVFLRTRSLPAVVACHMYCNMMGLPDMSFLRRHSLLFGQRWLILASYLVGIGLFTRGFSNILT